MRCKEGAGTGVGCGRPWRNRKISSLALVSTVVLMCLLGSARAQQVVVNGGFEAGSSPWLFGGSAFYDPFGVAHSGCCAALVNTGGNNGSVSQLLTLPKAGIYTFSFWESPVNFGSGGTIQTTASIGAQTPFNQVLNASGGLGQTSYQNFTTQLRLFAGQTPLSFVSVTLTGADATWAVDDVSLTFLSASTLVSLLPVPTPQNQLNTASAIDAFVNNSGGALPTQFQSLFNFSGSQLVAALTQLDGEVATDAEKGAFELMNEFLNLMFDVYVDGRVGGGAGGPLGFAPDQVDSLPPDIALAYAAVLKAPPAQKLDQRWTAWGSAFGGSAMTNGNPVIGSNNVTTGTFGYAAGMDYHYSPDTVLGFALAGGGTSWNLAQGLGAGRSDAFMAGVYGVTHQGPVYLAGALAFANNWFTTNRTALGDQLSASFQGQSYAGRLEGGYRFAVPVAHNAIGVTPYAAIQAQDFRTPAYSETDLTAGGFGLSYAAMDGTDTRSELGGRVDDLTALNAMPLILRARVAWAHDWVSNPALNAAFQALPGAGFTVFGAPIPHDSALTSAGAQLFFTPHWSLLAKFDGEFASGSQTYAGTGTLRYTW